MHQGVDIPGPEQQCFVEGAPRRLPFPLRPQDDAESEPGVRGRIDLEAPLELADCIRQLALPGEGGSDLRVETRRRTPVEGQGTRPSTPGAKSSAGSQVTAAPARSVIQTVKAA